MYVPADQPVQAEVPGDVGGLKQTGRWSLTYQMATNYVSVLLQI